MLARRPSTLTRRRRSKEMARTAVGPVSVVAAGGGVAVAELAHLPWEAVVVVGAGAWGLRMLAALASRLRRAWRQPDPLMVDPYAVVEPWRSMVRQAVDARNRFDQAVDGWPEGPLRDRLALLTVRVGAGTEEVFRLAKQAAALSAAAQAGGADDISRELAALQRDRAQRPPEKAVALDGREASLANRLKSVRRMQGTATRASDRLGVLVAQLNDAVTSVIELSLGPVEETRARDLLGSLEGVVDELEALQLAAGETGDPFGPAPTWPPAGAPPPGAPAAPLPRRTS